MTAEVTTDGFSGEIYCLKCKERRAVKNAHLTEITFKSKKGQDMTRMTWIAECGTCGKNVRQFAKSPQKLAEETAPKDDEKTSACGISFAPL